MCQSLLFAFLFAYPYTQSTPEKTYGELYSQFSAQAEIPVGELAVAIGLTWRGYPYSEHTLESDGPEKLTLNFNSFDCVTFVENCLAIARSVKSGTASFERFTQELRALRYRRTEPLSYGARLHYFSDWGWDNQERRLIEIVTPKLGGSPFNKKIDFMSTHREAYPKLKDDSVYRHIQITEETLSQRPTFYIPKEQLIHLEAQIKTGDILAITSSVKGLDIAHVGLAVWQESQRLHLLHASLGAHQVVVTETPIRTYLHEHRQHTGLMVFRPLEPKPLSN